MFQAVFILSSAQKTYSVMFFKNTYVNTYNNAKNNFFFYEKKVNDDGFKY